MSISEPTLQTKQSSTPRRRRRIAPPVLIEDRRSLDDLLRLTGQAEVVGVDTESNSLFAYYHRICLIQISLPDCDYVVDPLSFDAAPLGDLFADPACQKIFHAAENDVLGLKRDFGFSFANLYDTMLAARILGWSRAGLAPILEEMFGVKLDKRLQRTNWGQRPLRADQLAYAQLDTHYLFDLRARQMQELQAQKRWEEALENFQRLPQLEWIEKPFDPDGFWRIHGARDLSGRELAVLREVFLFREQEAQRRDRPPFKIFDNRAMIAISRRQPDSRRDLRHLPGMTQRQIQRYGEDILDAVYRGTYAPLPKPPRRLRNDNGRPDAKTTARFNALREWRLKRAEQRGVDTDVVFTNDALMAIARAAPATLDDLKAVNTTGPWKISEYGQEILDVLAEF